MPCVSSNRSISREPDEPTTRASIKDKQGNHPVHDHGEIGGHPGRPRAHPLEPIARAIVESHGGTVQASANQSLRDDFSPLPTGGSPMLLAIADEAIGRRMMGTGQHQDLKPEEDAGECLRMRVAPSTCASARRSPEYISKADGSKRPLSILKARASQ
jgi:hypothetical protein